MDVKDIASVAIYPPIGVARVGNSQEYFFASEMPGVAPTPPGGFKDAEGKVKKQAVRFRVYALNKKGKAIGELTASDTVSIDWRVHVANAKAAWYQFINALDLEGYAVPGGFRNPQVTGAAREQLLINPGPRQISGKNVSGPQYQLDTGQFFGENVWLGEVKTDNKGRLVFLGGNGKSASLNNVPATTFANNNNWHDDTSDGTVRATVTINGKIFEATPAMVAVTPPDFGPGLFGVVTMNDVVENLFITDKAFDYDDPDDKEVNFWRDIAPMLERMTTTGWVSQGFYMLFGQNSPSDFTNPELLAKLANPSDKHKALRKKVFRWFRDPESTEYRPAKVPPFYGDGFGEYEKIFLDDLPITVTQYKRLKKWAKGKFNNDMPKALKPFDQMDPEEQVQNLNRAPLEECLGGPFHPGIELTWPMRVASMWAEPYRLNVLPEGEMPNLDWGPLLSPAIVLGNPGPLQASGPGSLTRWLGVPWQTDEGSCLSGGEYDPSIYLPLPSFWAARVPNQVLSEDSYHFLRETKHENVNIGQRLKFLDYRQYWLRDLPSDGTARRNAMIEEWYNLGIVAPHEADLGNDMLPNKVWCETGRYFEEADQTVRQQKYANNLQDKPEIEEPDMVPLTGEFVSPAAAETAPMAEKAPEPKEAPLARALEEEAPKPAPRQRRKYTRGER